MLLQQVDFENLRFIQNVIDWTSLDNDMATIRSRGLISRRLARIEDPTRVTLEWLNYAIPVIVLLGFAAWVYSRRRQIQPVTEAGDRPIEGPARQGGGA